MREIKLWLKANCAKAGDLASEVRKKLAKLQISELDKFWIILCILALGALRGLFGGHADAQVRDMRPVEHVAPTRLMAPQALEDRSEGRADAPVTMIEYGSLTCIHCANFFVQVMPKLRNHYIAKGKVRYIFREFPFDAKATAGFMLARCTTKERYFPLLDVLYEQMQSWAGAEDSLAALNQIAKLAGFSDDSFKACFQNRDLLANLNNSYKNAMALGVTALPTFFINGDKYEGDMSFEELSKILDSHIKAK